MRAALMHACRGEGRVAPNPAVGCVIVNNGRLVGQGRTADGGRPHAETEALAMAADAAQGATAYVTLEPCAHEGKTPPCADALIKAGVARVVIGTMDPDERVNGAGLNRLQEAGIAVSAGVLEKEIRPFLAGFMMTRAEGRPLVTVKLATSLDGRIALSNGTSQWITGAETRRYVHELRSRHDAVLTSSGTLIADDPLLTCRLAGVAHQPLRVLVTGAGVLKADHQLARSVDQGPVLCCCPQDGLDALPSGVTGRAVLTDNRGKPDLHEVLSVLGEEGLTSVMVEAGGKFVAAMLAAGLVDRLIWMRSGGIIGGDGHSSLAALGLENLADGRIFTRRSLSVIGDDVIETLDRTAGEH